MIRLVAATNNAHKLAELRRILAPMGYEVVSLSDAGLHIEPEENADTFAGNARIKAQAVFDACGLPTVADDSGLCVDALNGQPGIYSARYGGEGLNDRQRTRLLLQELEGIHEECRGARFVSAICCILDRNTLVECQGECLGKIAFEPSGENGFGYDPVFLVGGVCFSEMTDVQKDAVSHRGMALNHLRELLKSYQNRIVAAL